ncbi:YukJ family protein [Glutamicibacter sp. MNS18]|uniref:YukJ family protein n=1 Tax=Glutamicibacter sp. MNS18 TaxID=2989817 RepID=UPI002235554A|nr:YukJ family protein [Glutamicibacter sp. MNS18]MCW4464582.1 YukJ family protein [Glutamicibacter sp. MNS18]
MPLSHGYGVLVGTLHDYYRDPPDNYGRFYHGNLVVRSPAGHYKCAIDVDPKNMPNGIQWRSVKIRERDFARIAAWPGGWHPLVSEESTGALDYIRSRVLHPPLLVRTVRCDGSLGRLLRWLRWNPPWNSGTGIQALTELERTIEQGTRCYVFGEPFSTGLGVHNIHQNQGDPIGGGFDEENWIWQDGATIVAKPDGQLVGFLNKFATQSFRTDDQGRPA